MITTVYDRNGNTRVYTHDSSYQLLSVKDELGYNTSYTYDAAGNMTCGPLNCSMTANTFDSRNRLIAISL